MSVSSTESSRPRTVAVLGAPGCGGEIVVGALARAGFVDNTTAVTAANDRWLRSCRASRVALPPVPTTRREPEAREVAGTSADVVAFDPLSALVLLACDPPPDLAVIVWAEPAATVAHFARAGIGAALGVALWDRYTRATLLAPNGLPTVVVDGSVLRQGSSATASQLGALWDALGRSRAELDVIVAEIGASGPPPHGDGVDGVDAGTGLQRPSPGLVPSWTAPDLENLPLWCEELLDSTLRAHRSMLEAAEAWQALVGESSRADALGHSVEDLEGAALDASDERARMIASWQWRVGRLVVGPFRWVRRHVDERNKR